MTKSWSLPAVAKRSRTTDMKKSLSLAPVMTGEATKATVMTATVMIATVMIATKATKATKANRTRGVQP